jgi:hypothetical protein
MKFELTSLKFLKALCFGYMRVRRNGGSKLPKAIRVGEDDSAPS